MGLARFFRNWWRKRQLRATREIFEYWDGDRYRKIDPATAYVALRDHPRFNLEEHPRVIAQGLSQPELGYMIEACGDVFGVRPYDPEQDTGLTADEMALLLLEFVNFLQSIQKKTESGSTPSPPTESASSTGPADQAAATN